jgi:hypothetical protein
MTCLVATLAITSEDDLAGTEDKRAKELVFVTNLVVQNFQSHHGIVRDGCLVLQRVSRQLANSENKRLGVVASLGCILACESMDQEVKDIADEILERQFK